MDFPKTLFKYRRFDKYTKDMLKQGYIYFCPANKLDDQFECSIGISKDLVNGEIDKETKKQVLFIQNQIESNSSNTLPNINFMSYFKSGKLDEEGFKVVCKEYSPETSDEDIENVIKFINSCSNNDKFGGDTFEECLEYLLTIQDKIGVCSLTELNDNQPMWSMYAKNYEGYCIENDIEKFLNDNPKYKDYLFRVIYSDIRNNNPIKIVLEVAFSYIFNTLELNEDSINIEDILINIVRTKSIMFAYQNEWRFLGMPNDKSICLPIKAVYLGRNTKEKNKKIILNISKECKFDVYVQEDDYERAKICFKKLED